jgi:hypothetical protein
LDLADLAQLDQHDRPNGVIVRGAHSVGFLQRGLDYFYNQWPWSALIKQLTFTLTVGVDNYNVNAAPINPSADFILMVKEAMVVRAPTPVGNVRPIAKGMVDRSQWLSEQVPGAQTDAIPSRYTFTGSTLWLWPIPDKAYTVLMPYRSMPSVLAGGTVTPTFPDDDVLVDYLALRCQEWGRVIPMGSARKFAQQYIGELQSSGLGREAETNNIPLDRSTFRSMRYGGGRDDWMGPVVGGA